MVFDFLLCNIAFGDSIPANQYAHSWIIIGAFVIQTSHYDALPMVLASLWHIHISFLRSITSTRAEIHARKNLFKDCTLQALSRSVQFLYLFH